MNTNKCHSVQYSIARPVTLSVNKISVDGCCVQEAERTLQKLDASMKQVETLRVELAAYYCDDESTFLLVDAFRVIRAFCDKLQKVTKVCACKRS